MEGMIAHICNIARKGLDYCDFGKVIFQRADSSQLGVMKMAGPGQARFSEGYSAQRVEIGKNTEADEISE